MLPIPTGSDEVTVIGLDPGTVNLGVCCLRLNFQTFTPTHLSARTYDGQKLLGNEWLAEIHGSRFRRIEAHRDNLQAIFERTQPIVIATESPYYSQRQPNAYGALMEVICAIRAAIKAYSLLRPLYEVDPPNVKRALGASGGAKKDAVKDALLKRTDLLSVSDCPVDQLDEHAIDAIAVAAYVLKALKDHSLNDLS